MRGFSQVSCGSWLSIYTKVERSEGNCKFGAFRQRLPTTSLPVGWFLRVISLGNFLAGPKSLPIKFRPEGLILDVSIILGAKLGRKAGDLNIRMSTITYSLVLNMVPCPQLCLVPTSRDLPVHRLQRISPGPLPGLGDGDARIGGSNEGGSTLKVLFKSCASPGGCGSVVRASTHPLKGLRFNPQPQ